MNKDVNNKDKSFIKTKRDTKIKNGDKSDRQCKVSNKRYTDGQQEKLLPGYANDPQWYNRFPELVDSTAKLAYSPVLGLPFRFDNGREFVFPGLMLIHYTHSIGVSDSGASGVNVLARKIYSFVRHANSGSANYEAADYMMYLLAMGSVYSFMSHVRRLYGLLNTYSVQNRYWPKAIIEAMGYSMNNLLINKSNLRALYNSMVYKVNSLAVPADFNYYKRCTQLQTDVYTDGPTSKPQLFAFSALTYFKFSPTTSETGSALTAVGHNKNFDALVSFADTLLNDLLSNEDIGIMSGDTLKAFKGNVYTLSPLEEFYAVQPVFDELMAHQIMNSLCVGGIASGNGTAAIDTRSVTQLNGYIYHQPHVDTGISVGQPQASSGALAANKVLNTFKEEVTPLDNIEFSRLIPTARVAAINNENMSTNYVIPLDSCGTEIVNYYSIWTLDDGEVANQGNLVNQHYSDQTASYIATYVAESGYFDYRPFAYITVTGAVQLIGPIQNYASASTTWIKGVHDTALLSLFDIPSTPL